MLDSGSNTSFISKNVVKKSGIRGPKTHLTINFAEGQKKSDTSEFLYATVVSNTQTTYSEIYASLCNEKKLCRPARTVSRTTSESYPHFKSISEQLHLSDETVD